MVKKPLNLLVLVIPFGLLIILFSQKSNLEDYLSKEMKLRSDSETQKEMYAVVDSLFNYSLNHENYNFTFLEFGAVGCIACKKMELVMKEIKTNYPGKVNVVFLNILMPANQDLMKHYGIVSIPTQVLLDKSGNEFFRHTGYISATDLVFEFNKILNHENPN